MQPKRRGWNEGILTEELRSVGGTIHKKGSTVRYKKYKEMDKNRYWTGEYEWHYIDTNNFNLIRTDKLLIS